MSETMCAGAPELESMGNGVWVAPGARIIDRSGRRRLPIGWDSYPSIARTSVIVDKSSLIADVIDAGYSAVLFCRPRRFGKSLNMTMMKSFFEMAPSEMAPAGGRAARAGADAGEPTSNPFVGTAVWEANDGAYREHFGAYPVVYLTLSAVKGLTWDESLGAISQAVASEYERHGELRSCPRLSPAELDYFDRIASARGSESDVAASLSRLCELLAKGSGRPAVLLVDEYDAPVMAGYANGYYAQAVSFLKSWLMGAVKSGGESVALSCLTGVQRVTKESVFSDLNNLVVDTPLTTRFDERFGFTEEEVAALASYLGKSDRTDLETARDWYDGYRFGNADVYNPWSVLNYFDNNCEPDTCWANTSENGVVGSAVKHASATTLGRIYSLLEPGGTVQEPLELGVVFPDVGVREGALWSMLYLAGYLTTDDVRRPNDSGEQRRLRVPNREVRTLFAREVMRRFRSVAGGAGRLSELHRHLITGDADALSRELGRILSESASSFDLSSENSVHMLLLGLCFGIVGYVDPLSNREFGSGRPDIRLEPDPELDASRSPVPGQRPLVTIEIKFARRHADGMSDALEELAQSELDQISARGYDGGKLPAGATGRVRWGIAVCGKRVATAFERAQ